MTFHKAAKTLLQPLKAASSFCFIRSDHVKFLMGGISSTTYSHIVNGLIDLPQVSQISHNLENGEWHRYSNVFTRYTYLTMELVEKIDCLRKTCKSFNFLSSILDPRLLNRMIASSAVSSRHVDLGMLKWRHLLSD